jgi:hypothetical protein
MTGNFKQLKIVLLTCFIATLIGCTAVSRSMGELTDNKYATARSGSVWIVPPPQLEPPSLEQKTAYISFRNISDADIDLTDTIRQAAIAQGWRLTNNPTEATYRLRSSLRFFGEVEPESGGAGVGQSLGVITGAAVGIGVGMGVANMSNSNLAGAAVGIGVGALIGAGLTNASRPREWALIVDVVLEEKADKPVTFELNTGKSSGMGDAAGTHNSRMASGGTTNSSNTSKATSTKTSEYFPHGIRLSIWANQMNMKEEEALPEIMKRSERVMTQMLPF